MVAFATDARVIAPIGIRRSACIQTRNNNRFDLLLHCPRCGQQHIDQPQPEKGWTNPPHRSHECQHCGWVWRPSDAFTNGVAEIQTKGQRDQSATTALFSEAITDDIIVTKSRDVEPVRVLEVAIYVGDRSISLYGEDATDILKEGRFVGGCKCRPVINAAGFVLIGGEDDCPVHGFNL